jgi:hypothetical protein
MAWHCRLLFIFSIQRFDEYKLQKCEECIGAFKNVQKGKKFHSLEERSAGTELGCLHNGSLRRGTASKQVQINVALLL